MKHYFVRYGIPFIIGFPDLKLECHAREPGPHHADSNPKDTPAVAPKGVIQTAKASMAGRDYVFTITGNYCLSSTFSLTGVPLSGHKVAPAFGPKSNQSVPLRIKAGMSRFSPGSSTNVG